MTPKTDWRRQGQERYLKGLQFQLKPYRRYSSTWDHDHCEFCGIKFMQLPCEGALNEGYATQDNYRWICEACFADFREEFGFVLQAD